MARAPLAKGDDGSGNRYPVREAEPNGTVPAEICARSYAGFGGCVKPKGHVDSYCADVFGYLFIGVPEEGDDGSGNRYPDRSPVYTGYPYGLEDEHRAGMHEGTASVVCFLCVPASLIAETPERLSDLACMEDAEYESLSHDMFGADS